jgi:hypothetical protein
MFRKFSFAVALTAAVMFSPTAIAGKGHGGHGHGGHGHGHAPWNNNWNHGHRHGHGRYWGGRWYGYGVGACWRWTPGGYVWICY